MLLFCLTSILPLSRAQDATISTSRTGIHTPAATAGADTMTSMLTLSTTLKTPSSVGDAPTDYPPELFPAATSSHVEPVHDASVFNYYFLFLFVFAILVAALVFWFHHRRKQRKQQLRQHGQHALARDLEGWAGTRRFMHGRHGQYQVSARVRREEGLNENGEAPPPYEPKSEVMVGPVQNPSSGVTLPLRTLAQDELTRAPPGYNTTRD
jgi:hypothetical protein